MWTPDDRGLSHWCRRCHALGVLSAARGCSESQQELPGVCWGNWIKGEREGTWDFCQHCRSRTRDMGGG